MAATANGWRKSPAPAKRGVTLTCLKQTQPQAGVPDLWLVFAPVKKTPADYLVQKATELGVSLLQPVFTRRTIVTRINQERMAANAIEAAEQSGRLTVPEIREAVTLDKLLAAWPKERRLYFCDEGGDAKPLAEAARGTGAPAAILTGPEGGFDPAEREMLRALAVRHAGDAGPAHPARRHRRAGGAGDLAVSQRRLALRPRLRSARDRRRPGAPQHSAVNRPPDTTMNNG